MRFEIKALRSGGSVQVPRYARLALLLTLMTASVAPGLVTAQEAAPDAGTTSGFDAIAVVDVTAESNCAIEVVEYSDKKFQNPIRTTGPLPCAGLAAVIYSFPISLNSGDTARGQQYNYVPLTGNAEADSLAVDQLIEAVAPDLEGALQEIVTNEFGETGPAGQRAPANARSTRCNSGVAPNYYSVGSNYNIYKYDEGPVDTTIFWSANFTRTSCTDYRLTQAAQEVKAGDPASQNLFWDDYSYSRRLLVDGRTSSYTQSECRRHSGTGSDSVLVDRPDYFPARPNGRFQSKTTNDNRDGCTSLGETWTGYSTFSAPSS